MADAGKFNLKKVIDENAHVSDLASLAGSGVKRVKVLDENTLQEMIERAVDAAISSSTQEERSRILADSRKQLTKLMNERDQFTSRAEMAEASKNDLMAQIEKLQTELKLLRNVQEQDSSLQGQLQVLEEREKDLQKKAQELLGENAWLREGNDKTVEELDKAQQEIARLKEEIERLNAEIAKLMAELDSLRNRLTGDEGLAQELTQACEENDSLRLKIAEGEGWYQELADAKKENARLQEELDEHRRSRVSAVSANRQELDQLREDSAKREAELEEARQRIQRLEEEKAAAAAAVLEEVPMPMVVPVAEEPPAPPPAPAFTGKAGKGLDIGTVNLVAAEQNNEGETELRLQRNVFIDVEITPYTKAMLTKLEVGYVIQNKRMYILGEPAFKLANVLNRRTRRPMADGLISPKEQDALPIMKLLIGSILGEPRITPEVCFYSVPGEPVDSDLSVAYHRDLFDAVLKSLGYKPSHILEGHAVTFAELAEEDFTGIGVSCGGGMFNVCVAYKSMPALSFSTARSGDWVDRNVAQALGIKPEKAAMLKEQGVDLMAPKNREEDAISIYYRNLIQYNVTNIAERFLSAENMPSFKDPISVVFSGGTAMAGNFIELVKDVFKKIDFPIPVKEVRLAKDPLNATAKGALVAAQLEMANQPQ
ncbi:MAG: hypothetical protein HY293_18415 [Planctomycetes bacterium]|nr:hypothetical protein [Planctomycetota bacterium]